MKKTLLLTLSCVLIICTGAFAQKANTDSLALAAKISEDQLKLGKLQNEVDQKTKNKQDASAKAQQSANENTAAATKLGDNPDDKKLARQANNKAGDAKSDARFSRKETRRLEDLNKDIYDLKNKIADEQAKLNKYAPGTYAPVVAPVPADTTQHQ